MISYICSFFHLFEIAVLWGKKRNKVTDLFPHNAPVPLRLCTALLTLDQISSAGWSQYTRMHWAGLYNLGLSACYTALALWLNLFFLSEQTKRYLGEKNTISFYIWKCLA